VAQVTAPQLKRLKDYPLNVWQQAADCCEYCGAPYYIQVIFVDESGNYGEVAFKAEHTTDCMLEPGDKVIHDVAGWEFAEKTVGLFGKEWTPIIARANVGPCLNCWQLVRAPIIMFLQEGKGGELDVCLKCAAELGFFKRLAGDH